MLTPPQIATTEEKRCNRSRHRPPPQSHKTGTCGLLLSRNSLLMSRNSLLMSRNSLLLIENGLNICPQTLWRSRLVLRQFFTELLCPLVLLHVV